jgi:hypothetical protein
LVTSGMGEGLEGGRPRASIVVALGAPGDLGSGREGGRRWLGKVEEGVGVLTVEPIEPKWLE